MLQIIAESSCDIPKEYAKKYHVKIVSATIEIDGELHDDYEFEGSGLMEFYKKLSDMDTVPPIYAPEPEKFEKVFEQGVFNGITEFIVFTVSGKIHGAYKSATEAKEQFLKNNRVDGVKIHVVDSFGSSHGCTYLLLKAAMMIENGTGYNDVVDFCESNKTKVKHYLAVKDVNTIKRAGKMSFFAAGTVKVLGIIPILTFNKTGSGVVDKKVMGMDAVFDFFVSEFTEHANKEMSDFVIIGYTTNIDYANRLKKELVEKSGFSGDIYIMQVRPATGALAGSDVLTVFYMQDNAGTASINSLGQKTRKLFKSGE